MVVGPSVVGAIAMPPLRQAMDTGDSLRLHAVILVLVVEGIGAVDDREVAVQKEEDLDHVRDTNIKDSVVDGAGAMRPQ